MRPAERHLISSSGPWEASAGYSRAVVVGDSCWVSGTTDAGPDGRSLHPGDAAAQARATLAIIDGALRSAGFRLDDVVRTRMYVTEMTEAPGVLAAHADASGAIRPAATIVAVSELLEPSLLVEIEVDARRSG